MLHSNLSKAGLGRMAQGVEEGWREGGLGRKADRREKGVGPASGT